MFGYAVGQLAQALTTSADHEDAATRRRADERVARWVQVLEAMSSGEVQVGSRTPVSGLPAWVTLEVLRGGFATGRAVAGGPLEQDEIDFCAHAGLPPDRALLFAHFVTEGGVAHLGELLDQGTYRIAVPEDAALLVVAWLVRNGDRAAALELLDILAPFAGTLRFAPRYAETGSVPPDHVWRITAGDARRQLADRRPNVRVETQREALAVWNPFSDRVLALWLERFRDGRLDLGASDQWNLSAQTTLEEYARLAAVHTLCSKHLRPKENLAILLGGLSEVVDTGTLSPRRNGFVCAAISAMLDKRGEPGSVTNRSLRDEQARVATAPAHREIAAVTVARLAAADPDGGLVDPEPYGRPVSASEATATGVPAAASMPPTVARVLTRARSAPVEDLLADKTIPSAEVLAGLVPQLSAQVVAAGCPDAALARLMAAHYRAFRRRRSLLLLDLAKQVQLGELPWVRAVAPHTAEPETEALEVLQRCGRLTLDYFPGTLVPNQMVQELDHLCRQAGLQLPFTEELAADIFAGRFSPTFARAAVLAAELLSGTLYAAYYDLDASALVAPASARPTSRVFGRIRLAQSGPTTAHELFGTLCHTRAGVTSDEYSVARNGMVIEQAQILTTHNLAALVRAGVLPGRPWRDLAGAAFDDVVAELSEAEQVSKPLARIKNAAYAWRQMIFYLSFVPHDEVASFVDDRRNLLAPRALPELIGGLGHVVAGGRFDVSGGSPTGRRFVGWVMGRPWVLEPR